MLNKQDIQLLRQFTGLDNAEKRAGLISRLPQGNTINPTAKKAIADNIGRTETRFKNVRLMVSGTESRLKECISKQTQKLTSMLSNVQQEIAGIADGMKPL